jgi:MoaE-MoaD fusion protein
VELILCYYAALRERAGLARERLGDLPEPLTVAALKRELERRRPELGSLAHVRAVLGTAYVREETLVPAGSEVHLLPPVSGGQEQSGEAATSRDHFELSEQPLDPLRQLALVGESGVGGQCLFVGTVRDQNRGRSVVRIDYEAFEAMAGPEMQRIFADCRRELEAELRPEQRLVLAVAHRVGPVWVGEPAVVVAAGSPHRDQAFRACRFLIDTLKERLPIWKHELYPDGSSWIGDRP